MSGVVTGTADRYADLLTLNRADLDQRVQAADRVRATSDLTDQRVPVIDDTWTTGAHAQSASHAPKTAGAASVGVVAIGRWFDKNWRRNADWLAEKRSPGWRWDHCCHDAATSR